jgi:hypothetical protein
MKLKIFLVAFICILFTSASYSQIKLSIGPEVGINIANLSATPDFSYTSRTGLLFGANLDMGFGHYISVQPGLRFVMKGAGGSDGAGGSFTIKLNYFEIPVLLKVTFPLTEVKPFLFAGPVLGINMSANEDDTPQGGTTTTTDVSNNVSGTDFSILFGGGVGFKVAPKVDLYASFGYQLGLSNILKNNTTTTLKNTGIQITAGAWFHL